MKIFIVGSINMDLVVTAPVMPKKGETVSGKGFMTNPGGKGANQAVAAAKLGGEAYMVGCVGAAFGDDLIGALHQYGVHTDYVRRAESVSSGIAMIVVSEGDNRIILDSGANATTDEALVDTAFADAAAGDFLICQLEIPLKTVAYALKKAKSSGMVTVLNPAPAIPLQGELFGFCDYLIPNQSEAEFYTGVYPTDRESAERCARIFSQMGVKNVVITLGENGSCLVGEGGYEKAEAVKVAAVDTTAAGDTYIGALVSQLSAGKNLKSAMQFASRAAAITVTRRGAQQAVPTRSEVECDDF